MGKLAAALLITLTINMFLYLGNIAVQEINPTQNFYNVEGSQLSYRLDSSGNFNDTNISGDFPGSTSSVSAETGIGLLDTALTFKNWLFEKVSMMWGIVTAVPDFLESMHMPNQLTGAISALWYIYIMFLIVAFFLGDRT